MKKANVKSIEKILADLEEKKDVLTSIFEEEESIISSRSDKWLESEKGEYAQERLSDLENGIASIESLFDELTNSIESYEG